MAGGKDAIVALLEHLYKIERYFILLTHSGVVALNGDRAIARFVIREHGRGEGAYYENLAVYNDELVSEADGWRFAKRSYTYRVSQPETVRGCRVRSFGISVRAPIVALEATPAR